MLMQYCVRVTMLLGYDTRSVAHQDLTLPPYRRSKCQNSFLYRGIQFWNSISPDLKNIADDANTFKRLLKRKLLN